jgi:DNA-binding transcriptional MerR regulator/effector-binding domain-containing protein
MRIGDFSRLSRVSVKTLRYYDELGLIKPVRVDEFTGYRYYEHEQLVRLNRLRALQDLGFSLEQIGQLLDAGLSAEQMRVMLLSKSEEIKQRLQEEEGCLGRLEAWLRQVEKESSTSDYQVVIKRVPGFKVLAARGVIPTPQDQHVLWQKLGSHRAEHNATVAGQWLALYHDPEPREQDWDVECCLPIANDVPGGEGVEVRRLPDVDTMACVVHQGPFVTIGDAYGALDRWVNDNGYVAAGPMREVGIRDAERVDGKMSQTDPNLIVEVQAPVEKA